MASTSTTTQAGARPGASSAWRKHGQYEYRVLTFDRGVSVPDARKLLTDEAEYGRWELARSRLYMGGERRVWLRRKIIKVAPTF